MITREIEQTLPLFLNHQSARIYFKKIFGNRFVMVDSFVVDGVKYYSYHLVINKDVYMENRKSEIMADLEITADNFFNSFQEIEISEDGFIHIIY